MEQNEINQRIESGRQRAIEEEATEHKPFGQTSEDVYAYTYWWVVGYNQAVDEAKASTN